MLKFSVANAKIRKLAKVRSLAPYLRDGKKVYSFDLLSGHNCPFAKDCLSKVVMDDGSRRIQDGKDIKFRCFSAMQEVLYPRVYEARKHNSDTIRELCKILGAADLGKLISASLPSNLGILRFHVGGDFFCQTYFDAAIEVARLNPNRLFYAYTKSLLYWTRRINDIPDNFVLTASRGGRQDALIDVYNLREAIVVFSQYQARKQKLPIDYSDHMAARPDKRNKNFALLLHAQQPAQSAAAKAWQRIRTTHGGYNRKS